MGAVPAPGTPRLVVIRHFTDIKAVTAMLQAAQSRIYRHPDL
jgi:hypothetical protein